MKTLPVLQNGAASAPLLALEDHAALQREVRALAGERNAVILAHNYQVPEVQEAADFVGDSLGLSQQAAATDAEVDRLLRRALHGRDRFDPRAREDRPDARRGRRLLARRHASPPSSCGNGGRAPRRDRRDVRQHLGRGQGGDRLLRARPPTPSRSSSTSCASTGRTPRSCSGPTCSSAPTSRTRPGARCTCGTASATSMPASAPRHRRDARGAPGRRPPDPPRVRLLDEPHGVRGCGRRRVRGRAPALHRRNARLRRQGGRAATAIVATETACSTALRQAAPDTPSSSPPTRRAVLPLHEDDHPAGLRDSLRDIATWSRCPRTSPRGRGSRSSG